MLGIDEKRGDRLEKELKSRHSFERAVALGYIIATGRLSGLLMRGHFGFFQRLRGVRLSLRGLARRVPQAYIDPRSDRLF